MPADQQRPRPLLEGKARVPHQRAVAEHPHAVRLTAGRLYGLAGCRPFHPPLHAPMFEASKARPVRLRTVVLRDNTVRPVASPGAPVAWPGGAGPSGRATPLGGRPAPGAPRAFAPRLGGAVVLARHDG